MEQLDILIIAFAFYSFVGWCGEVLYNFLRERRWVNRGLLSGPFFLLYGAGALGPVLLSGPHSGFWQVVAISAVWAAVVEYGGSALLERIGLSYWNYADKPLNLHGRICFESIAIFTAGLTALVFVFHPGVMGMLTHLPAGFSALLAFAFVVYALIDGHRQLQKQLTWHRQTGRVRNLIQ